MYNEVAVSDYYIVREWSILVMLDLIYRLCLIYVDSIFVMDRWVFLFINFNIICFIRSADVWIKQGTLSVIFTRLGFPYLVIIWMKIKLDIMKR